MIFNKKINYGSILIGVLSLSSQALMAASSNLCGSISYISPCTPIACTVEALNEAIIAANTTPGSNGSSLVILPANCEYLIESPFSEPTTGLPPITRNVTIVGGSGTIIARSLSAPDFRLLHVNTGATLKLQNLEIRDGRINVLGGGILDEGNLVLENITLSNNRASAGAGLYIAVGAKATVMGGSFLSNIAELGDASGGGIFNRGILNVQNTSFTSNSSITAGAIGAAFTSTTTINGSEFESNTANAGGAIGNGGTMSIDNSILQFNTTSNDGGGIINDGTVSIDNSTIQFNTASGDGGGIFNLGTVNLNNTTIVNNNPNNCSPLNSINGCIG